MDGTYILRRQTDYFQRGVHSSKQSTAAKGGTPQQNLVREPQKRRSEGEEGTDEQSKILPSDKDLVRQNILLFVVQVPPLLRAHLGECLKTIIHADYPQQWPVAGIRDPELPVRVDFVFALRSFVESCKDQSFHSYLMLIDEAENKDLVFTLETIVDKFGQEIAPYALGLRQSLVAAFWKDINTSEGDEEVDDHGDTLETYESTDN
ncbi:hypothetical protein M8C21_001563 [Ambrosia artemisiifolia]|uniref:Uncharacterized protein n=1 Tax=Ambrosia artemisiifolia TaxID=4212 RepID=A0AAD5CL61_AMBAR|nr:hypothetical protein M8C21_001563 [Ambrosia artemisiifolia]